MYIWWTSQAHILIVKHSSWPCSGVDNKSVCAVYMCGVWRRSRWEGTPCMLGGCYEYVFFLCAAASLLDGGRWKDLSLHVTPLHLPAVCRHGASGGHELRAQGHRSQKHLGLQPSDHQTGRLRSLQSLRRW